MCPALSACSFKLIAPAFPAEMQASALSPLHTKQAEAGREELLMELLSLHDGSALPVAGPLLLGSLWLLFPAMYP